ncbi:MAG: enoyl-CoA hydratase-related protein [Pseudomonadota bacterium]
MSNQDLVMYHREEHIGFITLNRPDKLNAMNVALWMSLGRAVSEADRDGQARVVIVRGRGRAFCAGLDLSPDNELLASLTSAPCAAQKAGLIEQIRKIQNVHTALEKLGKPTIAAIQGYCLGGGLELALCCDIRLASSDAVFALPESRLAIITDVGGLQRLPRVVGPGHAREISFRGHRFDAARAKEINLVNYVCRDQAALDLAVLEMAGEIAANPPLAVQGAKDVFLFNETVSVEESLEYNAARSVMILPSEDLGEAVAAVAAKRKGNYQGA